MIDISNLQVGEKVHYIPFGGCDKSLIKNGIVKEVPEHINSAVRVVYHCGGQWDRYSDYTSELTDLKDLKYGWKL